MKISEIKQLMEQAGVDPAAKLTQDPAFQQLRQLGGEKLAKDVLTAWVGDIRDYQRSGGKNFQPLLPQMLSDNVLQRRYGIQSSNELRSAISKITQLVYHAMPDKAQLHATERSPYTHGAWGDVKWAREGASAPVDRALYESLKKDIKFLLKS